jgi:ribose 5-phosphate isomerase
MIPLNEKKLVREKAIDYIKDGMVVGLGTRINGIHSDKRATNE